MVNKNEKFAFEVVYAKNLPKELKRIFVKALEKYHYVIPTWCHKIYVKYEEQDADGSPAHVQSLERYREAIISIAPSIVGESPEERIDRILLHEFIHILLCPLVTEAENVIYRIIENEKFRSWAESQLIAKEEAVVQDLVKVIKNNNPK